MCCGPQTEDKCNMKQAQMEISICFLSYLYLWIFYQDLICGLTLRHIMPCGHINTNVVALKQKPVQSVLSGSSLAQRRCGNVI